MPADEKGPAVPCCTICVSLTLFIHLKVRHIMCNPSNVPVTICAHDREFNDLPPLWLSLLIVRHFDVADRLMTFPDLPIALSPHGRHIGWPQIVVSFSIPVRLSPLGVQFPGPVRIIDVSPFLILHEC